VHRQDGFRPPDAFDEYRLIRLLGRGRMGAVYLAYDAVLAREVAIKFVSALNPSPTARQRFLTEARAAARLQHPNVVAVYRVGEIEGRPYLISEFVRGETLDRVPMPLHWTRALEIGIGLARGLAAAHRKGVLHRDIKPGNAILAEDGTPKLLDFSLAKLDEVISEEERRSTRPPRPNVPGGPVSPSATTVLPEEEGEIEVDAVPVTGGEPAELGEEALAAVALTRVGAVMGTPDYMPCEVWRGQPAGRCSDVYSLGAVLYELCAGAPPYGRIALRHLRRIVLEREPRPLAEVARDVDPRLAAIIDRCLLRAPEARFPSGEELRDALEEVLRTANAVPPPAGNPYRGLRAFEAEHRALFFGRSEEVSVVVERLRSKPFVVLAGESGVGKSSICRAGVLPLVESGALEGGRRWSSLTLFPGRTPLQAIAGALGERIAMPEDELRRKVAVSPVSIVSDLRVWLGDARGLVLFVDQLEELVTLAERSQAALVAELLGRFATGVTGVRLLATVRADLLTRVAALSHIGPEISRSLHIVRPLTQEKIREIIEGPARVAGVRFESEELVDSLVEATGEGGLPLLEFALAELWEARDRTRGLITRSALKAMGGVVGALARHADGVLAGLRPAQWTAARRMFTRLVTLEGTRARRSEDELTGGQAVARAALDALVASRLVVVHEAEEGSLYEVAHEALLQGWRTLRSWLHEDADRRVLLERLRHAAGEWQRLGRLREALWSPRQLAECAALTLDELNPTEAVFLERSRRAVRRARWTRWGAVLATPLIVAVALGFNEIRSRELVGSRVADLVAAAGRSLEEARTRTRRMEANRREAYRLFDAGQRELGQRLWSEVVSESEPIDALLAQASQTLESALLVDPSREDVRDSLGDTLFERALAAERDRRRALQRELQQRLALYDRSGARRARWRTAATLRVDTEPKGASAILSRYGADAQMRLVEEPVGEIGPTPVAGMTLLAGSYLLTLRAPGCAEVRVPFQLRRGEPRDLRLELPPEARIPSGFVFIPGGRYLFGSAGDESVQRGFFDTVPIHEQHLGPFLIARHEVTVGEWIEFLRALPPEERARRLPSASKAGLSGALRLTELPGGGWRYTLQPAEHAYTARLGEPLRYPTRARRSAQDWTRFPVTGISGEDAKAFAAWRAATKRTPHARLCTEQEWERSARGADDRDFPHGYRLGPDDANHDRTYGRDPDALGPDEVGAHPASRSPFGVDDLTGNAFEWTTSTLAAGQLVLRGGSYYYDEKTNQIPNRQVSVATVRDASVGLRLCASYVP
jgi:serine/threonine protein kinase/formylglycine-generating enzyme required for sulfatase activity